MPSKQSRQLTGRECAEPSFRFTSDDGGVDGRVTWGRHHRRVILLTGYYRDRDDRRAEELRECLRRNSQNRSITAMRVFVEDGTPPADVLAAADEAHRDKVQIVEHRRRLTYHDLFSFAATFPTPQRFVIANADIYFDRTLGLLDGIELSNQLLCLSRWDVRNDGSAVFFNHPSSQDAWIFETPLARFHCRFHLGLPGCDNRLAWEAAHAGIKLSNPSRSIRAHHLHVSGVRHAGERDRLHGRTLDVHAGHLDDVVTQP